jgi:hypothetical protein
MRWQQVKGRQEVEGNVFENGDGYMKVQWMKVYMPCKFMNGKYVTRATLWVKVML